MDCIDLRDQIDGLLKDAEAAARGSQDPATVAICQTLIVCTRALCCELSALRQVADAIETDLSEMEIKMPDQT